MSSLFLRFDQSDDPPSPLPVELAIARGRRIVNRPVKLLIAAGVLLALIGFQRSLWFVIAAPLGWIMGWCWWSYAAPRWRSWAVGRGTDPRALQYFAEKEQLLWPKGHWGERTEFGSHAVRQSLQPAEPYRSEANLTVSQTQFAPGFAPPASDRSFLLGVVYWTLAMPAGRWVLNQFREQGAPIAESFFIGLLTGIIVAAIAYSRESWRRAVSPEHAFGLGIVGVLLMVAMTVTGPAPMTLLRSVLGTLLLVAPASLMIMATIEWRRRRTVHE